MKYPLDFSLKLDNLRLNSPYKNCRQLTLVNLAIVDKIYSISTQRVLAKPAEKVGK